MPYFVSFLSISEYLGPLPLTDGVAVYAVMVKDGVGWSRKSWNWANDYVVAQTILLPPPLSCGELCMGVSPYPTIALRIHSPFLFSFSPLLGECKRNGPGALQTLW